MIAIRTALAWCAMVGEDHDPDLPSAEKIEAHIERVTNRACPHYAVTLNGRLELHSCPACSA
jgi:hypothetical protein